MYYILYCTCITHYIIYNIINILYCSKPSEVKLEGAADSGFPAAKEAIMQTTEKEETKQEKTVKA